MKNKIYIVTDMLTDKGYLKEKDALFTGLPVKTYFRKHLLRMNYFQKIADLLFCDPDQQKNADMLTDMLTADYIHSDGSEWYSPETQKKITTALLKISGHTKANFLRKLKVSRYYTIFSTAPIQKNQWDTLCKRAAHQTGIHKSGRNDSERVHIKICKKNKMKNKRENGRINIKKRWDNYNASIMSNEEFRTLKKNYSAEELAERIGVTKTKIDSYARKVKPARVPDTIAQKLLQIVKEDELKRNSITVISCEHPSLF